MITTSTGVAELGTILGIWAHPDDEAYLSGGLMAIARDLGARVVCVTATRGERGTADPITWPPDRLAAARTVELARCLGILGVDEHHWLDYADGGCASADTAAAVHGLSGIIDRVRPDTVLTFGPDGFTGHPDHRAVAGWAAAAVDRAGRPGTRLLQAAASHSRHERWGPLNERLGVFEPGFPMLVPDDRLAVGLDLAPGIAARKVQALTAQLTQTAGLIQTLGLRTYTDWVGEESFVERPAGPPARSMPGQVAVDGVPADGQHRPG
ncbi:MAG TPA: PIG-L family deacetylase [Nakamurella sp.]|jgi:LmbE family N-acetylglucosaminyl deacetylase